MKRKHMKRLVMSLGYSRNQANEFADYISIMGLKHEDWHIILEEIVENAEDTYRRFKEKCEDNERAFEIARNLRGSLDNPYPMSALNISFDFALDAKNVITKILVGRRKASETDPV